MTFFFCKGTGTTVITFSCRTQLILQRVDMGDQHIEGSHNEMTGDKLGLRTDGRGDDGYDRYAWGG